MAHQSDLQEGSSPVAADDVAGALPKMAMSTQAVHADDFVSSHRAIAPAMHVAVNYRYARDPSQLMPGENKDVSLFESI